MAGRSGKASHRELLRVAIDNALSQSPADFEELLKLLQEYGCEVSKRGKSYRLKLSGWEKAARMDSLGEGYGWKICGQFSQGRKHIPRERNNHTGRAAEGQSAGGHSGKIAGWKRCWLYAMAKVFNLKQMAQTMNYLSENNLLEYAVLEKKAAAARHITMNFRRRSKRLKSAWQRSLFCVLTS